MRGCKVFLGVRRIPEGQRAIEDLIGLGLHAEVLEMDVTNEESVLAAAQGLASSTGSLDVLVNNAAILIDEGRTILDLDSMTLHRTLETNVAGPLRLIQACLPHLGKGARIINISSGGGQLSSPSDWSPAYCISKTALNAVTVQMALALKSRGIVVNAACPGWVRTDMGGSAAPRSAQEGAAGIVWLALDAPASLTGGFFRDGIPIPW